MTTEATTEATTEVTTEATTEVTTEATTEATTESTTEATTEPPTNPPTEATTEPPTNPPTEATTEEIPTEPVPLGPANEPFNFDSFYDTIQDTTEEVIIDESTPLGSALPQTGQLPPELYYGIGSIISAAGIIIKRKIK
ncbi:MAG: hypothetical protein BGO41_09955 [Clostridiales bacterium 38-18]|nr:MAG: hypothetical protein BGO41_09955 [Clostridiales bacterium 38-18]